MTFEKILWWALISGQWNEGAGGWVGKEVGGWWFKKYKLAA